MANNVTAAEAAGNAQVKATLLVQAGTLGSQLIHDGQAASTECHDLTTKLADAWSSLDIAKVMDATELPEVAARSVAIAATVETAIDRVSKARTELAAALENWDGATKALKELAPQLRLAKTKVAGLAKQAASTASWSKTGKLLTLVLQNTREADNEAFDEVQTVQYNAQELHWWCVNLYSIVLPDLTAGARAASPAIARCSSSCVGACNWSTRTQTSHAIAPSRRVESSW